MFIYKGIYIYKYILHVYISVLVLTDHGQKWQTGTRKITKTGQDLQAGSEKKTTLHLLPELSPWRGWRKLLKPCREHPESWSLDCLCLGSRFAWSVFSAPKVLSRSWQGIFGFPSKECIVLGRTIKLQDIDWFSSLPVGKKTTSQSTRPCKLQFFRDFPIQRILMHRQHRQVLQVFQRIWERASELIGMPVRDKTKMRNKKSQARKILLDTALPESWSLDYLS